MERYPFDPIYPPAKQVSLLTIPQAIELVWAHTPHPTPHSRKKLPDFGVTTESDWFAVRIYRRFLRLIGPHSHSAPEFLVTSPPNRTERALQGAHEVHFARKNDGTARTFTCLLDPF
eukprot:4595617-Pyramimonas_sp.AAC.1